MKALLKMLLGLILGLVIAEVAFRVRDDAAFPHLNIYTADEKQGTRLEPNTEMKLRVGDNPLTTVHTNAKGYRGADWPAPTPGEVLVVGDSQVFGLGVEDNETFSAKLAETLKVPVLNAGTPTWGPGEYTNAVEEVLKERKPAVVLYVLNLSNDLFETDRPNNQRHRVWDGWAVRAETAPKEVTGFPFRKQLFSKSHLVFAIRKLLHVKDANDDGFASEGTWRDVVSASDEIKTEAADEPTRKFLAARAKLAEQLRLLSERIENHIGEQVEIDGSVADAVNSRVRPDSDGQDIFEEGDAEGGRSVNTTVLNLLTAAMTDAKNDTFLEQLAESKNDADLKKLIAERKALREEVRSLKPSTAPKHELPLDRVLARTRAACDAVGARLIVVALPLDVMVSAEEWKKYEGAKPIDLTPTVALREGLVRRAEALGVEGVDPTEALKAAEPGAFLKGDLHLTPKGHAAFATFLAGVVKEGKKKTLLALPEGRSWPPTYDEWRSTPECTVKGSTAAGCITKLVREWLSVDCINEKKPVDGITLITGGHGDAEIRDQRLLIPILEGESTKVRFDWVKTYRELTLDFPKRGTLTMAFSQPRPTGTRPQETTTIDPNDPLAEVNCGKGDVVGGALRRCLPSCDEKTPCKEGHCEPWPTGSFCAVP